MVPVNFRDKLQRPKLVNLFLCCFRSREGLFAIYYTALNSHGNHLLSRDFKIMWVEIPQKTADVAPVFPS